MWRLLPFVRCFVPVVVIGCSGSTSSTSASDAAANAPCDAGARNRLVSVSSVRELPQPITSLSSSGALWITTTNALYRWNKTHDTDPLEIAGSLGAPTALVVNTEQLAFIADGPGGRSIYWLPESTEARATPLKTVDNVLNDVLATSNGAIYYAVPTGVAIKRLPGMFPETEPKVLLTTEAPPIAIVAAGTTLFVTVPKGGTDMVSVLTMDTLSTDPAREIATTKTTKYFLPGATMHLWLDGEQLMQAPRDGTSAPTVFATIPGATRPFRLSDDTVVVLAGSRILRFAGDCREERTLAGPANAITYGGGGFYVSVGPSLLRSTIL